MADTKYSALTFTTPTVSDTFAVAQSGSSFAVTPSSIVQVVNKTIPGLTFISTSATATIVLGAANTFSTAATTTLSLGTWWVNGMLLIGRDTATTTTFLGRITDGTTLWAEGSGIVAAQTSSYTTILMTAMINYTNAAGSTISLQGSGSVTTSFIRQRPWDGASSTGTFLNCLKIA